MTDSRKVIGTIGTIFSNFYRDWVAFEGANYPSVENAYQAAKTLDLVARIPFQSVGMPSREAKKRGKRLVRRADWEAVKIPTMLTLLRAKYAAGAMREALLGTGDAQLSEINTWGDRFWGVYEGEGEDHLGRLHMLVRDELRASTK